MLELFDIYDDKIKTSMNEQFRLKFLYDLLKERPDYANISHKKMPTYEEHCAFVKSNPYKHWFLVLNFELTDINLCFVIATVYITKQNEIGIAVKKEYQRKGYATEILVKLINENKDGELFANIAPGNIGSQRLFEKLGFKHIQNTYRR